MFRVQTFDDGNATMYAIVTRWRTSKLEGAHSAPGLRLSCGRFLSDGTPRNADASSFDLANVYVARTDTPLFSARSKDICSESNRERPALSTKKMSEYAGFGRRSCTSPGPGTAWLMFSGRTRFDPFDAAYVTVTVPIAMTSRCTDAFQCCRYPFTMSGLNALSVGGGTKPADNGNGLLSESNPLALGKNRRRLNCGGLKYCDVFTVIIPES